MTSEKGKTNKKWTSSEEYRNNFDKIFGKKEESEKKPEQKEEVKKENGES